MFVCVQLFMVDISGPNGVPLYKAYGQIPRSPANVVVVVVVVVLT